MFPSASLPTGQLTFSSLPFKTAARCGIHMLKVLGSFHPQRHLPRLAHVTARAYMNTPIPIASSQSITPCVALSNQGTGSRRQRTRSPVAPSHYSLVTRQAPEPRGGEARVPMRPYSACAFKDFGSAISPPATPIEKGTNTDCTLTVLCYTVIVSAIAVCTVTKCQVAEP